MTCFLRASKYSPPKPVRFHLKCRYKNRYWGDLAIASASSGDAEARRPLPRARPPETSRPRDPPRLLQKYARRTHHEELLPLQPRPGRFLPQLAPTHLLPLRLRSSVVADETKKRKMKMMRRRRRAPWTLGLGTGLNQSGSRYEWPFPRLPSTHFQANRSNGSSNQWHWLNWGDTLGLLGIRALGAGGRGPSRCGGFSLSI